MLHPRPVAGVPGVCGEVLGLLALQRGQVLLQSFQEAAGSLRGRGWGADGGYGGPGVRDKLGLHIHTDTVTHTNTDSLTLSLSLDTTTVLIQSVADTLYTKRE